MKNEKMKKRNTSKKETLENNLKIKKYLRVEKKSWNFFSFILAHTLPHKNVGARCQFRNSKSTNGIQQGSINEQ